MEYLCRLASATGIGLNIDLSSLGSAGILLGVILGLVVGKPLGICVAAWFAVTTGIGRLPEAVGFRPFIGAACLRGIGDTVALLIADQAFPAEPGVAASPRSEYWRLPCCLPCSGRRLS